eukprot:scaffold368_cov258-Pinguiococcus_pyrenoidosus.AAC.12
MQTRTISRLCAACSAVVLLSSSAGDSFSVSSASRACLSPTCMDPPARRICATDWSISYLRESFTQDGLPWQSIFRHRIAQSAIVSPSFSQVSATMAVPSACSLDSSGVGGVTEGPDVRGSTQPGVAIDNPHVVSAGPADEGVNTHGKHLRLVLQPLSPVHLKNKRSPVAKGLHEQKHVLGDPFAQPLGALHGNCRQGVRHAVVEPAFVAVLDDVLDAARRRKLCGAVPDAQDAHDMRQQPGLEHPHGPIPVAYPLRKPL